MAAGAIMIFALVWTDDVAFGISTAGKALYERFLKEEYGVRWNYKRKGNIQKYIGLNVSRDRVACSLSIHMADYITGVFHRFVPKGHIPRKLPVKSKEAYKAIKVAASETERMAMRSKPYLAAVASVV